MADVDKMADNKVGEEEDMGVQPLKYYLMPSNTYVIIEKEWVMFTLSTAVTYLLHLMWMCYGVDSYSS